MLSFQQELAQVAQNNPLVIVAVALSSLSPLIVAAAKVADHRKGTNRDKEKNAAQTRIENGIKAVQRDVIALRDETRLSTQALEKRVDGAYAILTGTIDGEGENGVRGQGRDHEKRIRVLESGGPQSADDVGTYQQTPRLAR